MYGSVAQISTEFLVAGEVLKAFRTQSPSYDSLSDVSMPSFGHCSPAL